MYKKLVVVLVGIVLMSANVQAQTQEITVKVSPQIGTSINGHLELDRSKYINIASNVNELNRVLDEERFDRYLKEYEMGVGRALGMVYSESAWGNSIREDANRPGYIDVDYMVDKSNPTDSGLEEYKAIFGANSGLALHDRGGKHANNTYPDFMPMYTLDNGDHYFPENNEAHAEMAAQLMINRFTDFQRPQYYELVNEPNWKYYGNQTFYDFHTFTKRKFDELNIPTEVGGPCSSIGYYYRNNFGSMSGMTDFMNGTNFELDFYSFHIYDYMRWDAAKGDYVGTVSSGLPTEAVFDALASYTYNRYGKEFSFVGTEHGGYNGDDANRTAAADAMAAEYFPRENFDSDFEWEMERRSIENFVMVNSAIANTLTFMNHPHIVKKAVPFILNETSNWDPYYYSALLVKENFDKSSSKWMESKLIHYFEFFKDVKGRRVKSICDDNDIQHFSFVDGNTLIMLFHNQSNVPGNISIDVDDFGIDATSMKIRRIGKGEDQRPYSTEDNLSSLDQISIDKQESMVVFATFNEAIPTEKIIDMVPYYSNESAVEFSGRKLFRVKIPNYEYVEHAELRVGIGRKLTNDAAKEINIYLNGIQLDIPVEDSAERLTNISSNANNSSYATTRSITIDPSLLKATNQVYVEFADGQAGGVGSVVIRAGVDAELKLTNKKLNGPIGRDEFLLYPIPAQNKLNIDSAISGTLEIVDVAGQVKLNGAITQGVNQFNVQTLGTGIYIARIKSNDGIVSQRLSIVR